MRPKFCIFWSNINLCMSAVMLLLDRHDLAQYCVGGAVVFALWAVYYEIKERDGE